jgi:hypothetical protein
MAMWLKNQKNFERRRMIRVGRRAEIEAVDAEDIKCIHDMDLAPYRTHETCHSSFVDGLYFVLSDEEGKFSVGDADDEANKDLMEL